MTSALVAGALANKPNNGGEAWVRLSWILGLRRLGWDVWFVEELQPEICVDEAGSPTTFAGSINRRYFEEVTSQFGLAGAATLICGGATAGAAYDELLDWASQAQFLFNISGHLKRRELVQAPRSRVYIDLDPGFTQLWAERGEIGTDLAAHERHVTLGSNLGRAGCPLPTGGIDWQQTLPPVLIDEWPVTQSPAQPSPLTTIATWRSPYGQVELSGRLQGLKHHEFRKIIDLPRRLPLLSFEIALAIEAEDGADLDMLRAHGWRVVNPGEVAADPDSYRSYIQRSAGEFTVAQGVYVSTRSGWFSDRTACYLASGRPALVQDTGIGSTLPVGEGLVVFTDLEGAVQGAEMIAADYPAHCQAAREIAEGYLDSDRVLTRVLEALV